MVLDNVQEIFFRLSGPVFQSLSRFGQLLQNTFHIHKGEHLRMLQQNT